MNKNKTIRAYESDFRLSAYDADMDVMHPRRHDMVRIILDLLPLYEGVEAQVLDLGTGTGILSHAIAKRCPDCTIVAVDGSSKMLELARLRLRDVARRIEFEKNDFRQIELKAESLDAVVSTLALHHLTPDEKFQLFAKIRSALKPGACFLNGDLIISESKAAESKIQDLRVRGIIERAEEGDERFASYESTKSFLEELEVTEDDKPLKLTEDLALFKRAGFNSIEVYWKEYRECVIGGMA